MFLNQRKVIDWYKRILVCSFKYAKQCDSWYFEDGYETSVLDPDQYIQQVLQRHLPRILRIKFHKFGESSWKIDAMTFSSTYSFIKYCKSPTERFFSALWDPLIVISKTFLDNLDTAQAQSRHDKLEHVQLQLAIALCHELAHALWKYRNHGDMPFEPHLHACDGDDGTNPELGNAWERTFFGHRM